MIVVAVGTQGRFNGGSWVTSYRVGYSDTNERFKWITQGNTNVVRKCCPKFVLPIDMWCYMFSLVYTGCYSSLISFFNSCEFLEWPLKVTMRYVPSSNAMKLDHGCPFIPELTTSSLGMRKVVFGKSTLKV